MIKRCLYYLIALSYFSSVICCNYSIKTATDRRDPWIFRVNLDHIPRILVLSLQENTWLAYDTEFSRLYKSWNGGIRFNGPMYDDRHNVQPSSYGNAYILDTARVSPWSLVSERASRGVNPEYLGYSYTDGLADIQYAIRSASDSIFITEHASIQTSGGRKWLQRKFTVNGLAKNQVLRLQITTISATDTNSVTAEGGTLEGTYAHQPGEKNRRVFNGTLTLKPGVSELSYHLDPSLQHIPLPISAKEATFRDTVSAKENDPVELGRKMIALNDCAACHQMDKKAIGPSYRMIAEKYDAETETVDRLANKIISGGSGIWGRQVMTAHPALSVDSARKMVNYILSLDANKEKDLKPGLTVAFYKPGIQLNRIPDFIPGQKPNFTAVVEDLEFEGVDMSINQEKNDFFEFDDQFVMYATGYLEVPSAGMYEFLVDVDAGVRLFLNDKKVADINHTNYQYQKGTVSAELKSGLNPIRVEYYEDIYSSHLLIQWRKKGEKEFKSISPASFKHDPSIISETSPGLKEVYEVNAPGFGSPVDGVHPSFDVETVRPIDFNKRLSALTFLPDGRLAVSTWDSSGSIYILENVQGDRSQVKARLFASGLYEVMGLQYVNGVLYALQKWELTALLDTDGDEVADFHKVAANDWSASANFHEWAFGLLYRDGFFYFNTGIGLGGNGVLTDSGVSYVKRFQTIDRGKTLKVSLTNGNAQALAHGLKAPNGIGFGIDEQIFVTDNEGHMVPTNKLMHVPQSGYPFFGNNEVLLDQRLPIPPMKQPVLWMPESEVANSPSQPIRFNTGPYQEGQMIFGDVHHGGLNRAFIEKVNGQYQGALFRFTQGIEAGINRITYGPDGNIYMAGLGAGGDFGYKGQCCGLQRLVYNGESTFDILSVKARKNGMLIEFTEPLRAGEGVYTTDYKVQQFWYETGEHVPEGGVKNDIENIPVSSVAILEGGKKVFLELKGLKKEHVVYIRMVKPFLTKNGHRLWTGEAWYTLNQIPDVSEPAGVSLVGQPNHLLEEERKAGWISLFDGIDLSQWKQLPNSEWRAVKGVIIGSQGILMTDRATDRFELEFEWKAEEGAEGGLYYGTENPFLEAVPQFRLTDESEKQLEATQLSGSLTGLLGSRYKLYRPGDWNSARLVVQGVAVEHWLNGIRVLNFGSGDTKLPSGIDLNGKKNVSLIIHKGRLQFRNIRLKAIDSSYTNTK